MKARDMNKWHCCVCNQSVICWDNHRPQPMTPFVCGECAESSRIEINRQMASEMGVRFDNPRTASSKKILRGDLLRELRYHSPEEGFSLMLWAMGEIHELMGKLIRITKDSDKESV